MKLNEERVTSPPIPAATVILLRDAADGFELFLAQRHGKSRSFGGAYVFPGGKLDQEDHDERALSRLPVEPETLRRALGGDVDAIAAAALHFAACRETFEECGVLLASGVDAHAQREAVAARNGGATFSDVLERMDLRLDVSGMSPWSRWITPVVPSLTTKRFDTRFFVVALPAGQHAEHDNQEVMDSVWIAPRAGLEQYWQGAIMLAPPQIMTLAHLARFGSVREVLDEALRRPPPLIQPEPLTVDGLRVVAYPGDPGHPLSERVMPGPSRLVFRDDRFGPVEGYDAFFS